MPTIHLKSWNLPPGSIERIAAETEEARALGLSRDAYLALSEEDRKKRFPNSPEGGRWLEPKAGRWRDGPESSLSPPALERPATTGDYKNAASIAPSEHPVQEPNPPPMQESAPSADVATIAAAIQLALAHVFNWKSAFSAAFLAASEYAMLSLIEDAPRSVKLATLIIPLLAFLAIQFETRLRKLHRDLYPTLLALLVVGYGAFGVYAYVMPAPDKNSKASPIIDSGGLKFLTAEPPFAGKAVVGGPYLPEEIRKMILAVSELSEILHLEASPSFEEAKAAINVRNPTKVATAASKLGGVADRISKVLSINERFRSEINLTVNDRPTGPLVRELNYLASDITSTSSLPEQDQTKVLANDLLRLSQAVTLYDNWLEASTDNVDTKIQSLRSYKPQDFK